MSQLKNFVPFNEYISSLKKKPRGGLPGRNLLGLYDSEAHRAFLNHYYHQTAAIHSFIDPEGQTWDCMPAERQPSVKGKKSVLLKHTPAFPLEDVELPQYPATTMFATGYDVFGNEMKCEEGCVPVRRLTVEGLHATGGLSNLYNKKVSGAGQDTVMKMEVADEQSRHQYAYARHESFLTGSAAILSVWQPVVQPATDEMSLCQVWVTGGDGSSFQTVEAGWQVYPARNQGSDKPHFFIFWTCDNYKTCSYNLERPGVFFQKNYQVRLGGALSPVSITGGAQYEIRIDWILIDGHWWLYVNGVAIGYYEKLFGPGVLSTHAERFAAGGEVSGNGYYPAMGSGRKPEEGYTRSAYVRNMMYRDAAGLSQDVALTFANSSPGDYGIADTHINSWRKSFFYGGPGGLDRI